MERTVQTIAVAVVFVLLGTILFASGPASRLLTALAGAGADDVKEGDAKPAADKLAAAPERGGAAKGKDKDNGDPDEQRKSPLFEVLRKLSSDMKDDDLDGVDHKDIERTLDRAQDIFSKQKEMNRRNMLEAGRQLRVRRCEKKHVLVVVLDDVGFGELGCYGQQMVKTPYIDDLANQSVRFTQFYAGSSQDAASRGTLLSGKHTGHGEQHGDEWITVRRSDFTLPKTMYAGGYDTGYIGKWGMGNVKFAGTPGDHAVRYFYGQLTGKEAENVFPDYIWRNESKVELPGNKDGKREAYVNELYTEEAIAFLKRHSRYRAVSESDTLLANEKDRNRAKTLVAEDPFFLMVSYSMPISADGADIPGDMGTYSDTNWSQPRKNYASMITGIDAMVGKILAALKRYGLDENTMVVLTSDNGPRTNEVVDTQFFDTTGPLRGQQAQLFEGAIRVPLLIRDATHGHSGGRDSSRVFAMWDLPVTLASLADCHRLPRAMDGKVIADAVDQWQYEHSVANQTQKNEMLYWEVREGEVAQAVRVGNWKALRVGAKGAWQLFDLASDLAEAQNVAGDHPDEIRKIDEFAARSQAPPAMARRGEEE